MKRLSLLDLLVSTFPDQPRETLHSWVLCGEVYVDGERVRDPKRRIPVGAELERRTARWVSRAGEKLEAALEHFALDVRGKVFLDVGAATGGFTDCLLQHGASHVHAVDVAHNMLDYGLRSDERVTVHEHTNARDLPSLDPAPEAVVCDLSFRSLRGVAGYLLEQVSEGWGIFLVKPQFELAASGDSASEPFDGVIRSDNRAQNVLLTLLERLTGEQAYTHAICISPVRGRKGNREFLALLRPEESVNVDAVLRDAGLADGGSP